MKRGEIWTAAGPGDYSGKPRPVLILQSDRFDGNPSVTVCGLTRDPSAAYYVRVPIAPSAENGLRQPSFVMTDKISTLARSKLGNRMGRLDDQAMAEIEKAAALFLGLSG